MALATFAQVYSTHSDWEISCEMMDESVKKPGQDFKQINVVPSIILVTIDIIEADAVARYIFTASYLIQYVLQY